MTCCLSAKRLQIFWITARETWVCQPQNCHKFSSQLSAPRHSSLRTRSRNGPIDPAQLRQEFRQSATRAYELLVMKYQRTGACRSGLCSSSLGRQPRPLGCPTAHMDQTSEKSRARRTTSTPYFHPSEFLLCCVFEIVEPGHGKGRTGVEVMVAEQRERERGRSARSGEMRRLGRRGGYELTHELRGRSWLPSPPDRHWAD